MFWCSNVHDRALWVRLVSKSKCLYETENQSSQYVFRFPAKTVPNNRNGHRMSLCSQYCLCLFVMPFRFHLFPFLTWSISLERLPSNASFSTKRNSHLFSSLLLVLRCKFRMQNNGLFFLWSWNSRAPDCEQSLLLENPRGKSSRARATRERRSREKRARRETSEKRDCRYSPRN